MFNQYKFIPIQHKASLQAVIQRHTDITSKRLVELYYAAQQVMNGATVRENGITVTQVVQTDRTLGIATDVANGWFVQLSSPKGNAENLLNVGQKWVQESTNDDGMTVSRYW